VEDTTSNNCPLCSRLFTFFRRRHHCRKCGDLCCGDCSTKRVYLSPKDLNRERVCDKCYRERLVAGGLSAEAALDVQTGEYAVESRRRADTRYGLKVKMVLSSQWVWLPHPREAFVPAKAMFAKGEDGAQVFRTQDGEVITGTFDKLEAIALGSMEQDADNLIHLDHSCLSLAAILHTVRSRYRR